MKRIVLMLLSLGVMAGCHHRLDPLLEKREALFLMETNDQIPAADHVVLEMSTSELERVVNDVVEAGEKTLESIHISGPMGIPLQAKTTVNAAKVRLADGECEGCVSAEIAADGTSILGSVLSSIRAEMMWQVTVAAEAMVELQGREIRYSPSREWRSNTTVQGLPNVMNASAAATIDDRIRAELDKIQLNQPRTIATWPASMPFDLASVQLRAKPNVQLGAGLYLLKSEPVSARPAPDRGIRARMSAQTLLGLVEAAVISQPVSRGYGLDVADVTMTDVVDITLVLVRANRRKASRTVSIRGHFEWDEQGRFQVDDVTLGDPQKLSLIHI